MSERGESERTGSRVAIADSPHAVLQMSFRPVASTVQADTGSGTAILLLDDTTGDPIARTAGWVSFVIVGLFMDHERGVTVMEQ